MNDMTISVIITVYNMKDLVERCVNSVLSQSYRNIEVIIVDDGSVDGSGEVCDRLASMSSCIKVIHQENQGVAGAMNSGIEAANGEYIVFVDCDDSIDSGMLEALVNLQAEHDADYVQCGIRYLLPDGREIGRFRGQNQLITDKKRLMYSYFVYKDINTTLAGNLLRMRLFDNVRIPYKALSGDIQTSLRLLNAAKVFVQTQETYYNATFFANSVSRSAVSDAIYADKMQCSYFYDEFIKQNAPYMKDYMFYRRCTVAVTLYTRMHKMERLTDIEGKQAECVAQFKENYPKMRKTDMYASFGAKERAKLRLFMVSRWAYKHGLHLYVLLLPALTKAKSRFRVANIR